MVKVVGITAESYRTVQLESATMLNLMSCIFHHN
jgi:hypothetical protein